jgi:acyl-homoserine-lactone acylase
LDVCLHSALDLLLFSSETMAGRLLQTLENDGYTRNTTARFLMQDRMDPTAGIREYLFRKKERGEFEDDEEARRLGLLNAAQLGTKGSNAFAGKRNGGGSLLHINPHLSWDAHIMRFYEAHLIVSDASNPLDFYGCALLGMPLLAMGFNHRVGWAHTVNVQSSYSLFRLQLRLGPNLQWQYLLDSVWRNFEIERYTLYARGNPNPIIHEVYHTEYGPVMLMDIFGSSVVVFRFPATHISHLGETLLEQIWRQKQARNIAEFRAATAMQQLPMFTYVASDSEGELFYLHNSWTPDYGSGTWGFWTGQPVRTGTSEYLWSRIVPFERQPQLVTPASGFISNGNDNPWQATFPLYQPDPALYPTWISSPVQGGTYSAFSNRAKACLRVANRSVAEGRARGGTGGEWADYVVGSMSVEAEAARLVSDLIRWAEENQNGRPFLVASIRVLRAWDRRLDTDSRGALLFNRWLSLYLNGGTQYTVTFDRTNPVNTPTGIPTQEVTRTLTALERAAQEMEADGQALDTALGEGQKLPRDVNGILWASNGGAAGNIGTVRTTSYTVRPQTPEGYSIGSSGCTFKAVVEFFPNGTRRADVQMGYGQQSMPGPHNGDQWQLYSERRYRPALLEREDVEAHATRRLKLVY